MELSMQKVIVRNKLDKSISNVKVKYAQGEKYTGVLAYAVDWRTADVETGYLIQFDKLVGVGDISAGEEKSVEEKIRFLDGKRGYWQVYFDYNGKHYKLNKNNAQCNPWPQDNRKFVEVTLRFEGDESIRVDFVLDSGNAYFYAAIA